MRQGGDLLNQFLVTGVHPVESPDGQDAGAKILGLLVEYLHGPYLSTAETKGLGETFLWLGEDVPGSRSGGGFPVRGSRCGFPVRGRVVAIADETRVIF